MREGIIRRASCAEGPRRWAKVMEGGACVGRFGQILGDLGRGHTCIEGPTRRMIVAIAALTRNACQRWRSSVERQRAPAAVGSTRRSRHL